MRNLIGICMVMVFLCGCVGLVSCKHEPDNKFIDLGDPALEQAYLDYRKVTLFGDAEALKRIVPKYDPEMTQEQYEYGIEEFFLPGIIHDVNVAEGHKEWLESAYVVRKEVCDDGQKVKLWLGPETDKLFPSGMVASSDTDTIERKRFHEVPVQFKKDGDRWILYIG